MVYEDEISEEGGSVKVYISDCVYITRQTVLAVVQLVYSALRTSDDQMSYTKQ